MPVDLNPAMLRRLTWDKKFLGLATTIATWSKDPSTKVGCVIASGDHNVRAVGYNGFPRGVADDARLCDRPAKLRLIVHAEANAVAAAARAGMPLLDCTVYVTAPPCSQCAALLCQAGITRIVWSGELREGWAESVAAAARLCVEADVGYERFKEPL
jgi:dCMP deaminase